MNQKIGLSEKGNVNPGTVVTVSAVTDNPFSKVKFVSNGDVKFNPAVARTDSQGG